MKDNKLYYLIYRVHKKGDSGYNSNKIIFYGWTEEKNVLKAFTQQRDQRKYKIFKVHADELTAADRELMLDNYMIDFVRLKSAQSREEFTLFTTAAEMCNAEGDIQSYFSDLSSIEQFAKCDEIETFVWIFTHIDRPYSDALEYIGFRPREIEQMYAHSDTEYDGLDDTMCMIEDVYDSYHPQEKITGMAKPFGLYVLDDLFRRSLYSFEMFVKVLKDDL